MRTIYLPAFQKGCVDAGALAIMTAYSSYDGVPAVADSRKWSRELDISMMKLTHIYLI